MMHIDLLEAPSTRRPSRGGSELLRPETAAIFARQVLIFPLLVVILVCTSFLFGGRCAAWQWWTAVAAIVLVPFARRTQLRAPLRAAGLFALLLFSLRCLLPPFVWDDTTCPDMTICHLPMIQLLIEGWNPVADPMAEGITASLGLDLWGMAPLHVAFSAKTLAVFSAVAYSFIRDPYALTFSLLVFLWLGVLLTAVRMFRGFVRWALVAALVFVLPLVAWRMPVDLAEAFASCGLLLTMLEALRRKKCDWIALAVWGAWMATLKLNGAMGLVVFVAAFAITKIRKEPTTWKGWIPRLAAWLTIVAMTTALVSWNPLGTSWRMFGHPLYPYQTIDEERFPVKDLAWDLQIGNHDFAMMGRIGLFSHAYLSPKATNAFYKWYLRKPDFLPEGTWWGWKEYPSSTFRIFLWLMILVLVIMPNGKPWGVSGLVLLSFVPIAMVGFTRYQPWLSALGCLTVALLSEWIESRTNAHQQRVLVRLIFAGLFLSALFGAYRQFPKIEWKSAERRTVHSVVRTSFWPGPVKIRAHFAPYVRNFVPRYNYLTCKENYCRLLMKELGRGNATSIEPADGIVRLLDLEGEWDERKWVPGFSKTDDTMEDCALPRSENTETEGPSETMANRLWTDAPFGYWVVVSPKTTHFAEYYRRTESNSNKGGRKASDRFIEAFHAWFVTYPKEVWRRMTWNR